MNTIIERKFDCYCKKVLRNELVDLIRKRNKYLKNEISLESITRRQLNQLCYLPSYEVEYATYIICDCKIIISNENLLKSLKELSLKDLEIILLYYFLEMTDKEIAQLLNHNRKTINRKRNKCLETLRIHLQNIVDE